ncbi:S1 family peptidase [Actinokineospora sp.]|uniref:S1 family peptidase n=1 Tax=Actinokineospora sp. TaxID=1872133 RepID=UPI0040378370
MGVTARRVLGAAAAVAIIAVLLGQFVADAREQIVGGSRAKITDHPYVVYLATSDGYQFCGGTLVAPDKVVTAAHCAAAFDPADIRVVAGREDKKATAGEEVEVAKVWVHPDYAEVVEGNDVAVLTLADRVRYRTLPVADPGDTALYAVGTPSTVFGWGRTTPTGATSRYLLKADLPLVADTDCDQAYDGFAADSMVCAGLPEGGIDACQGDSGGPLVVAGRLAGIASWGEGCAEAGKPGVYTRVSAYAKEIAAQIAPARL